MKTTYADHERGLFLTHDGCYVDLRNPASTHVRLPEIAQSLGKQCRYTGQTRHFYSVAEHSLRCLYLAERWMPEQLTQELRSAILLHDCHEAFLGDMSRPLFSNLCQAAKEDILRLRAAWDNVIANKVGINPQAFAFPLVRIIDRQMMLIELWHLWPKVCRKWESPIALKMAEQLGYWPAETAASRWLAACDDLKLVRR